MGDLFHLSILVRHVPDVWMRTVINPLTRAKFSESDRYGVNDIHDRLGVTEASSHYYNKWRRNAGDTKH